MSDDADLHGVTCEAAGLSKTGSEGEASPLRLGDFDYELPPSLIAQEPLARRDASRLLVLDRGADRLYHRRFTEFPDWLRGGDLLVLNDTRVLAAKLYGRRADPGTSAKVETLLVERLSHREKAATASQVWRVILKGARHPGDRIEYGNHLWAHVLEREEGEYHIMEFSTNQRAIPVAAALVSAGAVPLPPYIRRAPPLPQQTQDPREPIDRERYQTVFARVPGAVAAPTAGLHFTADLIENLRRRGVVVETLTLHVGPGTFRPVRVDAIHEHRLLPEAFVIPTRLAEAVARAKSTGCRVVAVGTTVTRALESSATGNEGTIRPGEGRCDLFIYPGYRFRVLDHLLTNFHLPRSTLIMLASAFAGRERLLAAYAEAIRVRYRFYSYGDAMLVL